MGYGGTELAALFKVSRNTISRATPDPTPNRVNPAALWRAAVPIPMESQHPARRWLANRYLWREDFELPPTVRWLPKERLPRRNRAAGALALALAKAGSKRLVAVHLCYVDTLLWTLNEWQAPFWREETPDE